jgi:thiol-disulfide isomerase/thioredoxin
MSNFKRGATLFVVCCLASASQAMAQDRPADKILADVNAIEMPKRPEAGSDQKAKQEYIVKLQKATEKKAALIGELLKADPENAELANLLPERWEAKMMADSTKTEIDNVIARSKNEKLVNEASYFKAKMAFRKAGRNADVDALTTVADEFIKKFPKDQRAALMLYTLVDMTKDEAKKAELNKRIEKDYPDSPVAKAIVGERRLLDAVGKPFEISFVETFKGSQISSETLKGKVVVIDFWATWCPPCVAEIPKMKELYAKYKDQGVEFVGISLDSPKSEGGYDELKSFVEKNKVEWPQFYKDDGGASDFASSWGIKAIPTVFLVDADGKLASIEARGKLETLIPEYLEKAKKPKTEPKP